MYEHFSKNPQYFLFPNREWLKESLERLGVDLSNVFDEDANVDHIKREEVTVLFMLLWINMRIQDQSTASCVPTAYDLFCLWKYDRVLIARPTDTRYLQKDDMKALDRFYDKYGWFTPMHHFTIGVKGDVEYDYASPDNITNIDGAYNKAHGSVNKLRSNFKGFSFGRSNKNSVKYMMNWTQDRTDKLLTEFADNVLEEKQRRHKIARNAKLVVREMTGMSNKDYKVFLKKFKEKEEMCDYDWLTAFKDVLKFVDFELDHDIILEVVYQYNRNGYHLNKALLKLKEKINEGR